MSCGLWLTNQCACGVGMIRFSIELKESTRWNKKKLEKRIQLPLGTKLLIDMEGILREKRQWMATYDGINALYRRMMTDGRNGP